MIYPCQVFTARRQLNIMEFNTSSQEKIGEFVGVFAGDGNYTVDRRYHHQIRIFLTARDSLYIQHVADLFTFICNKKPSIYYRKSENVAVIRIISVELYNFITKYLKWNKRKTETVHLRKPLNGYKKSFLIGFLRGLIDTDGYIDKRGTVKFSTISNNLSKNVELSLRKLKINYRKYIQTDKRKNRKPITRIVVWKDFEKLIKIIKPEHFNYLYNKGVNRKQAQVV